MRFKAFNTRYRLLAPFKQLRRAEEQAAEDTRLILQNAQQMKSKFSASTSWAMGKRHIFLSEGIRQQLEAMRADTRRRAATAIQVIWKSIYFVLLCYDIIVSLLSRVGEDGESGGDGLSGGLSLESILASYKNNTRHRALVTLARGQLQLRPVPEMVRDPGLNRSPAPRLLIQRKNVLIRRWYNKLVLCSDLIWWVCCRCCCLLWNEELI